MAGEIIFIGISDETKNEEIISCVAIWVGKKIILTEEIHTEYRDRNCGSLLIRESWQHLYATDRLSLYDFLKILSLIWTDQFLLTSAGHMWSFRSKLGSL